MRRDSLDVFAHSPFVRIPFRLAFVSVRSRPETYLSLPDFHSNVTIGPTANCAYLTPN
jgi:hypothetical protein